MNKFREMFCLNNFINQLPRTGRCSKERKHSHVVIYTGCQALIDDHEAGNSARLNLIRLATRLHNYSIRAFTSVQTHTVRIVSKSRRTILPVVYEKGKNVVAQTDRRSHRAGVMQTKQ